MSSREEILASIRKHTQTRYEKPDIADMKRLTYPDKIEQFCAISRAVGGTAVVLGEGEDDVVNQVKPDVYAFNLVTVGDDTVIPDGVTIGKNTAISGVTTSEDYPNNTLEAGGTLIKAGDII